MHNICTSTIYKVPKNCVERHTANLIILNYFTHINLNTATVYSPYSKQRVLCIKQEKSKFLISLANCIATFSDSCNRPYLHN